MTFSIYEFLLCVTCLQLQIVQWKFIFIQWVRVILSTINIYLIIEYWYFMVLKKFFLFLFHSLLLSKWYLCQLMLLLMRTFSVQITQRDHFPKLLLVKLSLVLKWFFMPEFHRHANSNSFTCVRLLFYLTKLSCTRMWVCLM